MNMQPVTNRGLISCLIAHLILTTFLFSARTAHGANYHVDSAAGDNGNPGTEALPWRTLARVNNGPLNNGGAYQPGDQILFKSGGIWLGQIAPKGSGADGQPIVIDAYGSGDLPKIDGNGLTAILTESLAVDPYPGQGLVDDWWHYPGVVHLRNQSYWEIRRLDITNNPNVVTRSHGIHVGWDQPNSTMRHIIIEGCYVHDIASDFSDRSSGSKDKHLGGIVVRVYGQDTSGYRLNSADRIEIRDNVVERAGRGSIRVTLEPGASYNSYSGAYGLTNVLVEDNVCSYNKGDGIIVQGTQGGRVQHNVVHHSGYDLPKATSPNISLWPGWGSWNTTYSHNEVYAQYYNADGTAFDIDGYTFGFKYEYNYTHDNANGQIATFNNGNGTDNVLRYNVSVNEIPFNLNKNLQPGAINLYNNTFYNNKVSEVFLITARTFRNNVVVNLKGDISYDVFTSFTTQRSHNVLYAPGFSVETGETGLITGDPQFVAPPGATSPVGRAAVDGLMVKLGSPALNPGQIVANNGGADYWGNAVSNAAASARGAYNGLGWRIDDFEDGNANGFTPSGGSWTVVSDGTNKVYRQGSGTANNLAVAVHGAAGWADYAGEATIKVTSFASSGSPNVGINLRYNDSGNRYVFFYTAGYLKVHKKVGGVTTPLGEVPFALTVGNSYRFKVSVRGNLLDFWVDGILRLPVFDPGVPIASGKLALQTNGAVATFDDVVVK